MSKSGHRQKWSVRPEKLSRSRVRIQSSTLTVLFLMRSRFETKPRYTCGGLPYGTGNRSKDSSSIEAALNKWILPAIGDLPLGSVHNMTVKPLVTRMKQSLSARTVNKYVEYIEQVVASLKDGRTGEPVHSRKWDPREMDLPVVKSKEQRRPALNLNAVNKLVSGSEGDERRCTSCLLPPECESLKLWL